MFIYSAEVAKLVFSDFGQEARVRSRRYVIVMRVVPYDMIVNEVGADGAQQSVKTEDYDVDPFLGAFAGGIARGDFREFQPNMPDESCGALVPAEMKPVRCAKPREHFFHVRHNRSLSLPLA